MIKNNITKRLLFTFFMALLFIMGSKFPLPEISTQPKTYDSLFNLVNFVSGGTLQSMGVLALGLSPFITASLIIQLLSDESLNIYKNNQNKSVIIARHTKILTLALAILQSFLIVYNFKTAQFFGLIVPDNTLSKLLVFATFVSGSMITYFIADSINRKGIGNGISVLISTSILAELPTIISKNENSFVLLVFSIIIIFVISYSAQKKSISIPLQSLNHDKRLNAHNLNLKLMQSSVIPIIFATSLLSILNVLTSLFFNNVFIFNLSNIFGVAIFILFIVYFNWSYNKISYNGNKTKKDLIKSYMFIPNVPYSETPTYINKILDSLTIKSSLVLLLLVVVSLALENFFQIFLSGTSLLILISTIFEISYQTKAILSESNISSIIESEVK